MTASAYKAVEPLLGPSGQGGNFATRLADMLTERRARGSRRPGTDRHGRHDRRAVGSRGGIQSAHPGIDPTAVRCRPVTGTNILWHQGEGNAGASDVNGRQYRKNLLEVVASFRAYSINAPFFVALASRCGETAHPNAVNVA